MNLPFIIVLGEKGFLGKNIISSLRSQDIDVMGISRREIRIYSKEGVLSSPYSLDEVRIITKRFTRNLIVVNCVRENLSNDRVEFFDLLKFLAEASDTVLNFSTYIQYYEFGKDSQLSTYQMNQTHQSRFLQSSCQNNRFVDVALFTVFGNGDSKNSFLSSVVSRARSQKSLELTGLEQLVSYTWIGDIVQVVNRIIFELNSVAGRYSFWPEPPVKLFEIVEHVLAATDSRSEKFVGLVPYKGHELFTYDADLFPDQICPEFHWTSFEEGLAQWLPSIET
jgi:nucleoside-diphosphate-sugar epimerase